MIDSRDRRLIESVQQGLPITPRPYAAIGERLGMGEEEVIERLSLLKQQGLIKRVGVIVKHRTLGYRANAMVVFDLPDHLTDRVGAEVSQFEYVTLCYQRPRSGEAWPYNLYCMIHGKSRKKVMQQLDQLCQACGLSQFSREVLFSRYCFKQRGAIYKKPAPSAVRSLV